MDRRFVLTGSAAGLVVLLWAALAVAQRPDAKRKRCPKPLSPPSPEEREWQRDCLLPDLEPVPPETLPPVEANPRSSEAFMAGLNHGMSRELLWNEYPTDQRGTYVGQFWDPNGR